MTNYMLIILALVLVGCEITAPPLEQPCYCDVSAFCHTDNTEECAINCTINFGNRLEYWENTIQ